MKNTKQTIKVIGLFLGGIALIFPGSLLFGKGIPGFMGSEYFRQASMLILMGFAAMGYIFGFFRAKEGGLVMAFSGVLLGMNLFYMTGPENTLAAMILSLPLLISGVMLWWAGRQEEN